MTLQIDIEIIFPLARPGWSRLKTRHGHAVVFEWNKNVMYRARAIGH